MAEVVTAVRAAIDECDRRGRELTQAAEQTKRAAAIFASATEGSQHPAPAEAMAVLDRGHRELTEAAAAAVDASRRFKAYLATLEGGGFGVPDAASHASEPKAHEPPTDVSYRPERAAALQDKVGLAGSRRSLTTMANR